jgi:hypothetical protein
MMADPAFLRCLQDFNAAVETATCLAAYAPFGLSVCYDFGSVRNVPATFNVVRKLEALAADGEAGARRIAHSHVNQDLLREGLLHPLLAAQTRLGLVSCHTRLPELLRDRFSLEEVIFHRTPGEVTIEGSQAEPFGQWHARMLEAVSAPEPGVLYLVAAGIAGKVYCERIRQGGGVAIDIGNVADIWVRSPTRHHFDDVGGYSLL